MSSTAIQEMQTAVDSMNLLNTQIASAAEEQSAVSESIAENIENINQVSHSTEATSVEMSNTSEQIATLADDIHNMINQFEEAISHS